MYKWRSMKDQGMLVTLSNQNPNTEERYAAAMCRQSSVYSCSWLYLPTKNWTRTSNCEFHVNVKVAIHYHKVQTAADNSRIRQGNMKL